MLTLFSTRVVNNRFINSISSLKSVLIIKLAELTCRNLNDYFIITKSFAAISSVQKQNEIVALLNKLKRFKIRTMCEVGTGRGGTTYLLEKVAESQALLVTVDLANSWERVLVLNNLKLRRQTIQVIVGDSTDHTTLSKIKRILDGKELDFLFIDGDHNYKGVKSDFGFYSRLVKRGGWIAVHDVVPDYRTRFGIRTSSWSGDVPMFWSQIRKRWPNAEMIEDKNQDGYGIGLIRFISNTQH